jgi:hypothetical protein
MISTWHLFQLFVSSFTVCCCCLDLKKCERILCIYEQGRVIKAFDSVWALGHWFGGTARQIGLCWDFFLCYLWFEVWTYFLVVSLDLFNSYFEPT